MKAKSFGVVGAAALLIAAGALPVAAQDKPGSTDG